MVITVVSTAVRLRIRLILRFSLRLGIRQVQVITAISLALVCNLRYATASCIY